MPWENSLTLTRQINPPIWKIFKQSSNLYFIGKSLPLSSKDTISFNLRIISPAISEWEIWSKDEILCEAYSYIDSNFVLSDENLTVKAIESNNDTLIVSFFGQEINPVPAKLWRISLRPNTFPSWILLQSCSPVENQAAKTVKLKEFIEDVIRPVTNPFTVLIINIILLKD